MSVIFVDCKVYTVLGLWFSSRDSALPVQGNFCNSVSHVTTAGGEMVLASAVWTPGTQNRNLVYTRGPIAERNYLLLFSKCKTIKGEKPWSKDEGGKIQQNASNTHSKGVHRVCGSGHDKAQHEQPPYGRCCGQPASRPSCRKVPQGVLWASASCGMPYAQTRTQLQLYLLAHER